LYYLFTDAGRTRDHVLGFFTKEKISFDDYNLATIITLPPFQRKGYGMLMIEFSKLALPLRKRALT
jgi:histone acetyltransferase HTATIP/histone acetyltransferase MYST1